MKKIYVKSTVPGSHSEFKVMTIRASKYMPHQGLQEVARRKLQIEKGHLAITG